MCIIYLLLLEGELLDAEPEERRALLGLPRVRLHVLRTSTVGSKLQRRMLAEDKYEKI